MNLFDDFRDSTGADGSLPVQPFPHPEKEKTDKATGKPLRQGPKSLNPQANDRTSSAVQLRSLSQSLSPPELQTLRQAAKGPNSARSLDDSFRKEFLQARAVEQVGHYADPLEPLRERDLVALAQWFQRDDMYTIETEINQMLLHLLPEPCWEEDAFEFLREFL